MEWGVGMDLRVGQEVQLRWSACCFGGSVCGNHAW